MSQHKTLFIALLALIIQIAATLTTSQGVFAATYSASITTSGTISLDLSATGNSAGVATDNLAITSTCPLGYTVSIAGPTDTNLYKDGNKASSAIRSTSGTVSDPALITGDNLGTWGYSMSNSSLEGGFAALPSTITPIFSKTTASGDGSTNIDQIPVYYGASITVATVPGLYKLAESTAGAGDNAIVYYLTTDINCTSYQVAFNAHGGTGSMDTQRITEGIATPLNANTFTAPTGHTFNGWNTKEDGTGTHYDDKASVTDLTTVGNTITLFAEWKPIQYAQTTQVRYENADGSWGNYSTVETKNVNYGSAYSWSTSQLSGFNSTIYKAASVASYTVSGAKTNQVSIYRNTFTCTKRYRLENADGSWGNYTNDGSVTNVRYGSSCSYSKTVTNYKGSSSGANGSAGTASISSVTANQTLSISMYRNTFTCTKRYRLQAADGSYPSSYTADGTASIRYGATCSYSKTVTDYNNNAAKSTSATNMTANQTLSLDFPRNTYALTVNRNTTYISSVTGAGTYRWGQSVNISATAAANSAFNGWSQTAGTTGSFGNAANASTTFVMPKSAATIYADGKTTRINIQDLTNAQCQSLASSADYTVYDSRDNNSYTVRYIAGSCWMTQNLRYVYTTSSLAGNSGTTFTAARQTCASGTTGCYYNYCAASAGTICRDSVKNTATSSICPAGWSLPSYSQFNGVRNSVSVFKPASNGQYRDGSLMDNAYGWWWSSDPWDYSQSYALRYDGGSLTINAQYDSREYGKNIRCVRSS